MKKLYLSVLIFIIFGEVQSQIINFPDANFKARLLAAAPGLQIAGGTGSIPGNPFVKIDTNNDGEIQVAEALAITRLWLQNANITNISGLENFTNLRELQCHGNSIATMDLSPLTQLTNIAIFNNHITTLNVAGLSQVELLGCAFNELTSLDLTGMIYMNSLQCQNNQLASLNISNATNLLWIECQHNLLTTLDTNNLTHLVTFNCAYNDLESLYLKNNADEINFQSDFSNNPNLRYICADDFQLAAIQDRINGYGYANCYTNSNCDFNPGNPTYFIEGIARYDELNDGCDNTDIPYPNLTLALSNGITTGNVYSGSNGEFNTASQSTSVTITPQLVNMAYFTVTPSSLTATLSDTVNPLVQNFCVTPNGSHPDLEILLSGWPNAFDSSNYYYTLTYRNKGTQTQSGNLSFSFNDAQQDFVTSTPAASAATNLLTWNFTDLKPFETRTIEIQFYMNSQGANPTLFDGDALNYVGTISSSLTEETPIDNTSTLNLFYTSAVLGNPNPSFSDYFAIYPNPTPNILNIKTKSDVSIDRIAVYNLIGQSVLDIKNTSNNSIIDVYGLGIGTYIIKIFSDKGIFNSKFVKN